MRILGIDPALSVTGYGLILVSGSNLSLLEAGIIRTKASDSLAGRLDRIYRLILRLLSDTKPQALVLEKLYAHYRHPTTAYILGEARGVICLASTQKDIPLFEYAATRVKKAIVGKGLAAKEQVKRAVAHILKINPDGLSSHSDVSDALALAIAHSYILRAKL
jgi:crossover junction endodeoxyribonuclease RuvC